MRGEKIPEDIRLEIRNREVEKLFYRHAGIAAWIGIISGNDSERPYKDRRKELQKNYRIFERKLFKLLK